MLYMHLWGYLVHLLSFTVQIPWHGSGNEKYYFENENVSLLAIAFFKYVYRIIEDYGHKFYDNNCFNVISVVKCYGRQFWGNCFI